VSGVSKKEFGHNTADAEVPAWVTSGFAPGRKTVGPDATYGLPRYQITFLGCRRGSYREPCSPERTQ
jgi:hypothetical protein